MSVHVVVDSTASIPKTLLEKYSNLHCVSLNVVLGDKHWKEVDIPAEKMFELADSTGYFPRTSQPSPGEFQEVVEPLIYAGNEVIVITMSAGLSGTFQSVRTAMQFVGSKNVYVIDSLTVADGMIHLAQTALMMAEEGATVSEIVSYLEKIVRMMHTVFMPETLDYLYKNGRIGSAAALFGTILNIKPILHLVDGKVKLLEKVRTRTKALKRMLAELEGKNLAYVGIPNVCAEKEAAELAEQVRKLYPGVEISVTAGGSVLGAHLGAGVIGIIYQEELH